MTSAADLVILHYQITVFDISYIINSIRDTFASGILPVPVHFFFRPAAEFIDEFHTVIRRIFDSQRRFPLIILKDDSLDLFFIDPCSTYDKKKAVIILNPSENKKNQKSECTADAGRLKNLLRRSRFLLQWPRRYRWYPGNP